MHLPVSLPTCIGILILILTLILHEGWCINVCAVRAKDIKLEDHVAALRAWVDVKDPIMSFVTRCQGFAGDLNKSKFMPIKRQG